MATSMPVTAQIISFPKRIDLKRQVEMSPTVDYSSAAWYHADAIKKAQSAVSVPHQGI